MSQRSQHQSRLVRIFVARRRLLVSVAAGIVLFALLPGAMRLVTRLLMGWDLTALIYVGSAFFIVATSTVETCRRRAALYDNRDWVIMMIIVGSAAASLGAIFSELAAIKLARATPLPSLLLAAGTVALSWTFTHVVFTLHYANLYYQPQNGGVAGGLDFPGKRPPDYRDFVYYSFVIGCAAQTGDVDTLSADMRRVSLIHGIVAFVFNTAILALTINVGASLLS